MLVLVMTVVYEVHLEMASGGMIYIPSLITIGSGIRVILMVTPQQSERM
jgi:hypothetical protein